MWSIWYTIDMIYSDLDGFILNPNLNLNLNLHLRITLFTFHRVFPSCQVISTFSFLPLLSSLLRAFFID